MKFNRLNKQDQIEIATAIKDALASAPEELLLPEVPVEDWCEVLSVLDVDIDDDFLPSKEDVFRAVELIEFSNGGYANGGMFSIE